MTSVTFCSSVSDIGIPASVISRTKMISIATIANGWSSPLQPPPPRKMISRPPSGGRMQQWWCTYREVMIAVIVDAHGDLDDCGDSDQAHLSLPHLFACFGIEITGLKYNFLPFAVRKMNRGSLSARFGIIICVGLRGPDTSATLRNYYSCQRIACIVLLGTLKVLSAYYGLLTRFV